ncbi:MAG: hypothetical protein IPM54_40375 [Polyangiaceae bacterium]|nr:hypothetical protein [Polyangiaceae bacterium]
MRSSPARVAFVLTLVASLSVGIGCGSATSKTTARGRTRPAIPRVETVVPKDTAAPPPAFLPSHVIARFDDEQSVPYVARRGDEMLLVFNAKGKLFSRLLGADGAPKAEQVDLGVTVGEVFTAAVAPVGEGWLATWVEGTKGNATVRAVSLDASGRLRSGPYLLAQSADDVSFIEIVEGTNSALVVWEVPRDAYFDVIAVPVKLGQTPPPSIVLSKRVMSWGMAPTDGGAAIATLVDAATEASEQGRTGRVLYADVGFDGKVSPPVTVSAEATAHGDLIVTRVGARTLLAWTDVREIDASVYVAAVEKGGRIATPPRRATPPVGEQALVSVVGGAGAKPKALLAWEDLLRSPREGRLIHLGILDADAMLQSERATLVFSASGPPDITPDGDGFAVTTLAPIGSASLPAAAEPPIWPAFVRFGPDLSVRASEPLRAEPFAATDGIPELTRSLSCHGGTCTTLASIPGPPATVAMLGLPVRSTSWQSPASRDPSESPPFARTVTSIYDGEHLAKVSSTELSGGTTLAAWVTYFIESNDVAQGKPSKKAEPLAVVGVRSVSPTGELGKTQILSDRAVSIGGVALDAARTSKTNEAAIAWVSRDKGETQVQLAKLGPDGAKIAQKALTTVKRKAKKGDVPSEASDVAIAYAPPTDPQGGADDGWIVAWVDTRDGNAEVYAARVDRSLRKVVADRRLTDAPGDAAEVQIVMRGKEVVVVWSDARQSTEEGNGDIYAVRLDARTLRELGPPMRLFASPGHSRSPSVALAGNDVVVAWIEDATTDAATADAGVRIAVIDSRGALAGAPVLMRAEDRGTISSIALTCTATQCRGAAASAIRDSMQIDAFELSPGAPPGPRKTLVALSGGANADVSPAFANASASTLLFGDESVGGNGRVRFMSIGWSAPK